MTHRIAAGPRPYAIQLAAFVTLASAACSHAVRASPPDVSGIWVGEGVTALYVPRGAITHGEMPPPLHLRFRIRLSEAGRQVSGTGEVIHLTSEGESSLPVDITGEIRSDRVTLTFTPTNGLRAFTFNGQWRSPNRLEGKFLGSGMDGELTLTRSDASNTATGTTPRMPRPPVRRDR